MVSIGSIYLGVNFQADLLDHQTPMETYDDDMKVGSL